MIAPATIMPGHDAQARKARVVDTSSTSIVAPTNVQTQISNSGSVGVG
jgi:hypothetical protein